MTASPSKGESQSEWGEDLPGLAFENNLSYRLSILGSLLGRATAEIYMAEEFTLHQWKVMSVICRYAPIPASEIMRWVTLDKAAVSRAVRKLQTRGLIERRLSDGDARVTHILPTRKGRDMNDRVASRIAKLQGELLASVDDAKVRAMFEAFDRIEAVLRLRFGHADQPSSTDAD
ncbi:MAG: MarR family winged helix-turn-helix transcriptional regulator [Pigmentiphaga sp.]|uniref:MarR family winged helix-turn-helix transcriptional regulator n=1 Tax=Pigmentiphaga sp. TaxID=1977564 RepID=UPI0029A116ED|nr:MarR family winged helix-turn-helix transcriptional regulator [Pigmentiphaga sp.]MDX3905625.1 MarR family winged helix-turn-helix transcriptional regulator [Pigmentiphaga sp.]